MHFSVGDKVILDSGIRGEVRGKAIGKDFYDVMPDKAKSLAEMVKNIRPEQMCKLSKPKLVEI